MKSPGPDPSRRYRRLCFLAQGGMGSVELAILRSGPRFQRLFALKRPFPHLRNDPSFRNMFLDEARIAGLIRDPHVVSVVDFGDDTEGPFLAMEYVDGLSVSDILTAFQDRPSALPVPLCLSVVAHAARGLHAAHELRDEDETPLLLVHRDVSPQNLLIGRDGLTRVTDFGIAKALGNLNRTAAGTLKGNMGYLAPECLRFEDIDRRADLFSLGVVLFEMLSGRRLYPAGAESEAAKRILSEAPPDISDFRTDVPPEVVALLFRLLAKDRNARPATGEEVARTIEQSVRDMEMDQGAFDNAAWLTENLGDQLAGRAAEVAAAIRQARSLPLLGHLPRPARHAVVAALGIGALATAWLLIQRGSAPPQHGLRAEYFSDPNFKESKAVRIDPQIHFDWSTKGLPAGLANQFYSVRWTGFLQSVQYNEQRICIISDDGARLWIDDKLLVDDWGIHSAQIKCGLVQLQAQQKHSVRLEYFQHQHQAVIELLWGSPHSPGVNRLIPSENLLPD